MTRTIELTQGKVALVDDADFEWLNAFKWYYDKGYAVRNIGTWPRRKKERMHRVILGTPGGMETDHINGDKLDNRRGNLRVCSHAENLCNVGRYINNSSGFKGVAWHKQTAKWQARIMVNGHSKQLGCFDTAEEAAHAYDEACINLHGDFARKNIAM